MFGLGATELFASLTALAILSTTVTAQTQSSCNPITGVTCPADPALGKSVSIDFTKGASDLFTTQGTPTFDSNGASFAIAKSGDSPQINSKFYIMFGKVEITMKAAPGAGIVSSAVLQSDDLDEIDWEWLGSDNVQVQSNYFGKGQTTTYNRGAFHAAAGNQGGFKTYSIDWTSDQIVWAIDGQTVRALASTAAQGQYPQTPMQVKVGAWSGGDSANAPGTIKWAGGPTNYAGGPYVMTVKSIKVTDYSTGTSYSYTGQSGTWQSIVAAAGKVNPSGNGGVVVPANVVTAPGSSSVATPPAPAVTSASPSMPYPFGSTHKDSTSTYITPSVYPWISDSTTMQTAASRSTALPGLPAGWSISNSGKAVPPSSAAPTVVPTSSSSSPVSPASVSVAGAPETKISFNDQGFPTTIASFPSAAAAAAASTSIPISFDPLGFLITSSPPPSASLPANPTTLSTIILTPTSTLNGSIPIQKDTTNSTIKSPTPYTTSAAVATLRFTTLSVLFKFSASTALAATACVASLLIL